MKFYIIPNVHMYFLTYLICSLVAYKCTIPYTSRLNWYLAYKWKEKLNGISHAFSRLQLLNSGG